MGHILCEIVHFIVFKKKNQIHCSSVYVATGMYPYRRVTDAIVSSCRLTFMDKGHNCNSGSHCPQKGEKQKNACKGNLLNDQVG